MNIIKAKMLGMPIMSNKQVKKGFLDVFIPRWELWLLVIGLLMSADEIRPIIINSFNQLGIFNNDRNIVTSESSDCDNTKTHCRYRLYEINKTAQHATNNTGY